jgi:hypothetical protein
MNESTRRIVFRDDKGEVRWFSEAECQLRWTGYASGEFGPAPNEELALLPGDRWVVYGQPIILDGERLSKVRFVSAKEAMDWLLVGGHEPPECLLTAFEEKSIVKSTDKRNENLLQVEDEDDDNRSVVIDVSGAKHWGPCSETDGQHDFDLIPEWFYHFDLYRLASGRFVLIRQTSHRDADHLAFPATVKRLSDEEAGKWLLFKGFDPPEDIAEVAAQFRFQDDPPSRSQFAQVGADSKPLEPSEELRATYRDPDNYWRNVWLYEQRKSGKNNSFILAELAKRAEEFAPIESDNAIRMAIDSIAGYHRWEPLKGKSGRPKARDRGAGA